MFARAPRKVAVPAAGATCPSCDADLPAGSHFCATCGAPAQAVEAARLSGRDKAMERHAELLGAWLDTDVKRASRFKPALLTIVLITVVAGGYLAFRSTSVNQATDVRRGDSSIANTATLAVAPPVVVQRLETETAVAGVTQRRVPQVPVRRKVVEAVPAVVPVKRVRPAAPGVLQMLVTPWAAVSIDGRTAIPRARGADTLAAGVPHRLHFERPGFATIDTSVTLRSGEERLLEVQMKPVTP